MAVPGSSLRSIFSVAGIVMISVSIPFGIDSFSAIILIVEHRTQSCASPSITIISNEVAVQLDQLDVDRKFTIPEIFSMASSPVFRSLSAKMSAQKLMTAPSFSKSAFAEVISNSTCKNIASGYSEKGPRVAAAHFANITVACEGSQSLRRRKCNETVDGFPIFGPTSQPNSTDSHLFRSRQDSYIHVKLAHRNRKLPPY